MSKSICSVEGCGNALHSHGVCGVHWQRWLRRGSYDLLPVRTSRERFWAQVDKNAPGGCWQWLAPLTRYGYGQFLPEPPFRSHRVHRLAYEWLVGPIPEGLQLDHLCRNRGCVNPDHLEAVTCRENLMRGAGLAAANAAKTHCLM